MQRFYLPGILLALAASGLSGCTGLLLKKPGRTLVTSTVDSLLGIPAAQLAVDVGTTFADDRSRHERVAALADDYAEFVRSREAAGPPEQGGSPVLPLPADDYETIAWPAPATPR